MNRIVAYAKERGLHIIPVINSPGHMDSILVAMEELGMKMYVIVIMEKNQTYS